jgi:hypothetical protein
MPELDEASAARVPESDYREHRLGGVIAKYTDQFSCSMS